MDLVYLMLVTVAFRARLLTALAEIRRLKVEAIGFLFTVATSRLLLLIWVGFRDREIMHLILGILCSRLVTRASNGPFARAVMTQLVLNVWLTRLPTDLCVEVMMIVMAAIRVSLTSSVDVAVVICCGLWVVPCLVSRLEILLVRTMAAVTCVVFTVSMGVRNIAVISSFSVVKVICVMPGALENVFISFILEMTSRTRFMTAWIPLGCLIGAVDLCNVVSGGAWVVCMVGNRVEVIAIMMVSISVYMIVRVASVIFDASDRLTRPSNVASLSVKLQFRVTLTVVVISVRIMVLRSMETRIRSCDVFIVCSNVTLPFCRVISTVNAPQTRNVVMNSETLEKLSSMQATKFSFRCNVEDRLLIRRLWARIAYLALSLVVTVLVILRLSMLLLMVILIDRYRLGLLNNLRVCLGAKVATAVLVSFLALLHWKIFIRAMASDLAGAITWILLLIGILSPGNAILLIMTLLLVRGVSFRATAVMDSVGLGR